MIDFASIDRSYDKARSDFRLNIPEYFNFGYDIIDAYARNGDGTAIVAVSRDSENVQRISFSQLSESSNRFANALAGLRIKPSARAVMVVGRIPAWYTLLFGCMKAGVVPVPGTNLLTAKDISYRINYSGAELVIVTSEHCDKVDVIRGECPTLKTCIVVDGEHRGWLALERLLADASAVVDRQIFPRTKSVDMMMAYFTSGTTSMPKLVPRDHGYALAHAATALFWMDLQPGDVHWSITDTGWAKAAWGMLFPQLLLRAPIVLYNSTTAFDTEMHLRLISKLGVTTFCAPPTVYRLFAQQDLSKYDLSSLRRCMGAGEPLNPEVMRFWKKHTGTVIADGYGQTETINVVANFPDEDVRYGSMGKPVPGYDVDVVDEKGNRLPNGEVGHLAIRITDPYPRGLFRGYLVDGGLDVSAFHDGWYFTGDTATRDGDGYLWFVGRADDLIGSAGYRISPFEVESALLEHEAVAESAVVGKEDATRGQIVKAYVILAKGFSPSVDLARDIQEFCKNLTAPYKYPREIEFVESLPKTISGKIRRIELRQ